jgi:hydrogenase maturation protease
VLPQHRARIETCHQLTPELAEAISRADLVIFIDAEYLAPVGTLSCRHLTPGAVPPGTFSHYLTPRMLLACVREWYGTCPEAVMFSVSGQSFDCGEGLSPAVAAVLPELLGRICALVS